MASQKGVEMTIDNLITLLADLMDARKFNSAGLVRDELINRQAVRDAFLDEAELCDAYRSAFKNARKQLQESTVQFNHELSAWPFPFRHWQISK